MVQAAPVLPTRPRVETLERWHKALVRAIDQGLEVFTVADTGERMVTSASKLDTLHRTDGRHCTCEAAVAGDPVCQHRAVVRSILGWLPAETPAELGIAAPAPVDCPQCNGGGVIYVRECARAGWPFPDCPACGGTGTRTPSSAPRSHGRPAVQPVSTAA
jgi:hypothetical protein